MNNIEAQRFERAAIRAVKEIANVPEVIRKTYGAMEKKEAVALVTYYLAMANAVCAAAASVLGQIDPPPPERMK